MTAAVHGNRKLPWVTVGNVLEGMRHPSLRFPNMERRKTSNSDVGVNGAMQVERDRLAPAIRASGPPIFHYRSLDGGDRPPCLSVREVAAIQSFPNDYEFLGSLNSQYRQVGNSVPCGLARAVARAVAQVLRFVYAEEVHAWLSEVRNKRQPPKEVIEIDDDDDEDDEDSEAGIVVPEEQIQPESTQIDSFATSSNNEDVGDEGGVRMDSSSAGNEKNRDTAMVEYLEDESVASPTAAKEDDRTDVIDDDDDNNHDTTMSESLEAGSLTWPTVAKGKDDRMEVVDTPPSAAALADVRQHHHHQQQRDVFHAEPQDQEMDVTAAATKTFNNDYEDEEMVPMEPL